MTCWIWWIVTQTTNDLPGQWLKKGKVRVDKTGMNTRPREPERCPNNHPLWHLYHKRIKGTPDTIICCRECEKNE
jgi:hypothetical protein